MFSAWHALAISFYAPDIDYWCVEPVTHEQFICTIPEVFMLVAWWLIPESPRWLLTQGKWEKATAVMQKAVKSNNLNDSDIGARVKSLISTLEKEETEKKYLNKSNLFDLLKHPRMRLMTIILYLTWFTNTFVYYGLSLNTGSLLDFNPFISFLISGAVEFPAYLVTLFLLRSFGRRIILSSALVISGTGLLLTLLVKGSPTTQLVLAMIGKFCITGSFAMVYVYTAEIFPTTLRNVGVGSSSMVGRIGSILAPFVKELAQYTGDNGPMLIFGLLAIGDAILILLVLPETLNKEMPDTLDEVLDGFSCEAGKESNKMNISKPLEVSVS
ncbi:Organic cation transporter protein [Halotydeus destructor]|nr:Organic cation transporter protein [Halotydeus destructor]